MGQVKKQKIKYKNVSIALAILLIILLAISTACSHDNKKEDKTVESSSVQEVESKEEQKQAKNFKYITVENDKALGKGVLALVNDKNPWKLDEADNLDGIYGYMFDKDNNQVCRASSTNVQGNKNMLKYLNSMLVDFNADSDNNNVVISNIYSGDSDDKTNADSPEHMTGYAVDFNTYDAESGTFPLFKADGEYRWIGENCWKYGFVQRYKSTKSSITNVDEKTNHYRYVGYVNAEIMTKNNLCLEEYVDYVKKYSVDKPLDFQSENGAEYMLYYISAGNEKSVKLPILLNDDGSEYKYGYSGNNIDGYIVWIKMSDEIFTDSSVLEISTQSNETSVESSDNTDDTSYQNESTDSQ